MAQMNGGEATVEAIRAAGIGHVFGLLGSSTMEMYDALYDCKDITYVGVRDEAAGTHMADAYGRVTGIPGVILAGQAGPGATNLVTGLAQAKLAYSPLIAITGLVASDHIGRDAFQEVDQNAIFSSITKHVFNVPKPERIPEFIKEAARIATSGRRGPVVVQIPRDHFATQIETEIQHPANYAVETAGTLNADQMATMRDMILAAERPVIVAGAGFIWGRSTDQLVRLAESMQIPVTASAGHPDVMPNDHPLYFGQVGPRGNDVASGLARESDLVLALGTRLGFNTTFYTNNEITEGVKIIQVDIDPMAIGRYYPVSLGIIGDAGSVASALADALAGDQPSAGAVARAATALKDKDALWATRDAAAENPRTPLSAERCFFEIRQAMPRDAIVCLDAGTICMQATDQLRHFTAPGFIAPLDMGLVGAGYAFGLGAKAGAPDRPVVSMSGDGGFGMTLIEMSTAVQNGLNTVAIVFDNGCWGAEKAYQRDFYNGRFIGSDIESPAYDKVAELCGAKGYAVSEPGELSDALSDALKQDAPAVIQAKVDPNAMVSFRKDSFKHRSSQ